MWLFENPIDPKPFLNKCVSPVVTSKNNKLITKWQTPYGVTFSDHGFGDMYFYKYDSDLNDILDNHGCLSGNDIVKVLNQLQQNPNQLRTKPNSIIMLENAIGTKAHRHSQFGKWQIVSDDEYSMINNPFSASLGYTNSADEFELYFFKDDPLEHLSVSEVLHELKRRNYL